MQAFRVSIKEYLTILANDYSAAVKDLVLDARQAPFKTTVFTSSIFGLIFACRKNPGERELRNRLAELRQQMVLIPWTIHSQKSVNCLERYTQLLNEKRLNFVNFWFLTFLVERRYNPNCNSNEANDRLTRQWLWIEFWKNCFDIGLFGRFWNLENSFQDCDICEEEFSVI
ncbi:hypothetical protein Mgra_00004714 [Meloidogyne graminicola]|uniref:Uncharacterized protein n=1 Tax=Meloidogyne graminicola TaxID=189291 RepID=A0A8S9ZRD7_9BILA|nr:hypothetical protein Mgra_00004714 [Meloidogyne graminicola]